MSSSLPFITLLPKREKSLINRHPWVFSGAIAKLPPKLANGDAVDVLAADGRWLGTGFYSPKSQISVRIFDFEAQGSAHTTAAYWAAKIANALHLRQQYVATAATNAYRLLHAEGDWVPGLIADVYANVLVVQIGTKGMQLIWPLLAEAFAALGFAHIYLKVDKGAHQVEGVTLAEGWAADKKPKGALQILENGLKFQVDILNGQKTGFFLDQRDARLLLKQYAPGRKVLNTFSYSGGFSIYALAGGATAAVSVDVSAEAIALADANAKLNGMEAQHTGITSDVFEYLDKMDETFDMIVLDPPAFAKRSADAQRAARGYKQLNLAAFRKIKQGGIVFTFSCSHHIDRDLFRKIVFSAAADSGRQVRILHQTTQSPDHPISIYHPEGEYLKGLVLEVS